MTSYWFDKGTLIITLPQPWVEQRWGREVNASELDDEKHLGSSSADAMGTPGLAPTDKSPYFFQYVQQFWHNLEDWVAEVFPPEGPQAYHWTEVDTEMATH